MSYYLKNPLNGYRRLSFMMLDKNVVAVSPSTVYRVLKKEEILKDLYLKQSKKGTGFNQPSAAHKH